MVLRNGLCKETHKHATHARRLLVTCSCAGNCLEACRLLQGDTVTQGLKKVTDDMKTKNRADRSGVVSTTAGPASSELHPGFRCDCSTCSNCYTKVYVPGLTTLECFTFL